jgi:hypothetical protein
MVFFSKKKKQTARCQCDPTCKRPPLKNSPFCKVHQRYCPRRAPLSGYEPDYQPDLFNKLPGRKGSNNCFAYAFDYKELPKRKDCTVMSCSAPFPQPGRASGYPKWSRVKGKRCPDLVARFRGDVPGITRATFTQKCPRGTYKIAPVVDPDEDYHFYRQDSNGYWSHKPGSTSVTHLDTTGRPIYDPFLASRASQDSGLDYDTTCGFWCVPVSQRHSLGRGGARMKTRRNRRRSS